MKIYVENGEKIENFNEISDLLKDLDSNSKLYSTDDKKENIKLIYRPDHFIFKNEKFYFKNLHEKLNIIFLFIQFRIIQLKNLQENQNFDIFVNLGLLPIDSDISEFFFVDIEPFDLIKLKTYETRVFDEGLLEILGRRNLLFKNNDRFFILYLNRGEIRMATDYISRENMFIYNYYNMDRLITLNEYLLNEENKNSILFRKLFLTDYVDFEIIGQFDEFLENLTLKKDYFFLMEMRKYLFDFKDFRDNHVKKLSDFLKKNKRFKKI